MLERNLLNMLDDIYAYIANNNMLDTYSLYRVLKMYTTNIEEYMFIYDELLYNAKKQYANIESLLDILDKDKEDLLSIIKETRKQWE